VKTAPAPYLHGTNYWLRIPSAGRRAVRRSLYTADAAHAQTLAAFVQGLVDSHEVWLLGEIADGTLKVPAVYEAFVRRRLPEFVAEQRRGDASSVTLTECMYLWATYMQKVRKPAPVTQKAYLRQVATFAKGRRLHDLTATHLRDWHRGLTVGQPNRYRAAMRQFCRFLMDEGLITADPTTTMPSAKEASPRDSHLSPDDATYLCEHWRKDRPEMAAFQAFLICTTADVHSAQLVRLEDIVRGRLPSEERSVLVRGTKRSTRERRCYVYWRWRPLWDAYVEPWLDLLHCLPDDRDLARPAPRGALAFPGMQDYEHVRQRFDQCCAELGLTDYTMKDHRHTWAVQAFKDRLGLHAITQQLGHADPRMSLRVYGRHMVRVEDFPMAQHSPAATKGDGTNG
jgi:integrase